MDLSTKKFPSALTKDGYASSRSSFVVPALDGNPWFVDLQTGKKHEAAYLVYVGRSITADDVIQKFSGAPVDPGRALKLINSLIAELQRFKLGNVLAIEKSNGEQVQLRLVAVAPKARPGPRMP